MQPSLLFLFGLVHASLVWIAPLEVDYSEAGYQVDVHAQLDVPFEVAATILSQVERYYTWVPTVSSVRNVVHDGKALQASFVHDMPLFPDFPCDVEVTFQEASNSLDVAIRFIRCIFDNQSLHFTLTRQGDRTDLDLAWTARLERWHVPGFVLKAFLKSVAKSGARSLDERAHLLVGETS